MNDKLRTLRKQNSPMILATQSPREGLDSALRTVIKDQCPTQIYFMNSRAEDVDYGEQGMGLTTKEIDIVRSLKVGEFLLKQDTVSVPAQLMLDGLDDHIAVLSARKSTIGVFDRIRRDTQRRHGGDVAVVPRGSCEGVCRMKKLLLRMSIGTMLAVSPAQAQLAVIDNSNLVAQAKNLLQELKSYATQLQQLEQEIQQVTWLATTAQSMIQNPNLGSVMALMGQLGLTNDLPINPNAVMGLISGYGGISSGNLAHLIHRIAGIR